MSPAGETTRSRQRIVLARITKSPWYGIVVAQVIATFLAATLCLAAGRAAAWSALLAGLVCVLPGLYMLGVSLRPVRAGSSGLGLAIRGEVGRLALSAALFAWVFVFCRELHAAAFFATFIMLQAAGMAAPLLNARRLLKRQ